MTRVLVTGGLGFVGSYTVDKLVTRGYKVRIIDNLEWQVHHGRVPSYRNTKAEYMRDDIRRKSSLLKALNDVDYVIHLAAAVGVGQSFWEARKYMNTNAGATAALYECILCDSKLRKSVKKIVVASSKSIYGEGSYKCSSHGILHPSARPVEQLKRREWDPKCPKCGEVLTPVGIREDKPLQNLSPYALSKYATETLAVDYAGVLAMPTVAFRYFNVYGPRQSLSNPYTGVIAIFLSRMKNRNPPVVFEDGKQLRDYIYVEDVASMNVQALESGIQGVFNLGTGEPHSLLDVLEYLQEFTGYETSPKVTGEYRPGDNRHDYADVSKLIGCLNTRQFTDLRDGMKKLSEWAVSAGAIDLFDKEEKERRKFLSN